MRDCVRDCARSTTAIKPEVSERFKVIIYKLFEAWEADIVMNELRRVGLAPLGNNVLKLVLKLKLMLALKQEALLPMAAVLNSRPACTRRVRTMVAGSIRVIRCV